jgi:dinuclear metal center YbgI/SA1388 family protein
MVSEAIKAGISIIAAHTNLDSAKGGINDILAEALELRDVEVLEENTDHTMLRLVIHVFTEYEKKIELLVRETVGKGTSSGRGDGNAVSDSGVLHYARHGDSVWRSSDEQKGVVTRKIEVLLPPFRLSGLLEKIREGCPAEKFFYHVEPTIHTWRDAGLGRVGNLPEMVSLGELLEKIKKILGRRDLHVLGEKEAAIRRVAVLGGSGGSMVSLASKRGADLLITGDVGHHHALEAVNLGLCIIDGGHFATERAALRVFSEILQKKLKEQGWRVDVIFDSSQSNPMKDF